MAWDGLDDFLGIAGQPPATDYLDDILAKKKRDAGRFDIGQALGLPPPPQPLPPLTAPLLPPPAMGKPQKTAPRTYANDVNDATQQQVDAVLAQSRAEQAKAAEVSERTALASARSMNEQRQIEEDRQRHAADIDKRQQQILSDSDALSKKKIKPEVSGLGVVLSAASGFLAGLLDGKKGVSQVVNIVERTIERNTQRAMAELAKEQQALSFKQGALDKDYARGTMNTDARLKAELSMYDQAIKGIQAEAARFDNPIAEGKTQQLIGAIQEKKADKIQDWRDKETSLGLQKQQVGIAGGHLSLAKQEFEEKKKQNFLAFAVGQNDRINEMAKEERARQVKGAGVPQNAILNTGEDKGFSVAVSEKVANDVFTKKVGAETYIAANRRLAELRKANPGQQWDNWIKTDAGRAAMDSVAQDIVTSYAVMNGQGALGDEERKAYYKGKVGDIGQMFISRDNRPKIQENIKSAERNYNILMKSASPTFAGGFKFDAANQRWYRPEKGQKEDELFEEQFPVTRNTANDEFFQGVIDPNPLR